jgi:hypothetical protein
MTCRCAPGPGRCGRCDDSLSVEIAARNDRCGHVEHEQICLRPLKHDGAH